MPNRAPKPICCPQCRKILTEQDRVPHSALWALFSRHRESYQCQQCGLRFSVSQATPLATANDLPPLKPPFESPTSDAPKRIGQPRSMVRTQPRTTRLVVTDVPDIPGIHNSEARAALKIRHDAQPGPEDTELQRLRRIERKYRALKKVNRHLARASAQRH